MTRLVTGVGGIFFRSKDHKGMAGWYEKHFGINSADTGWIWLQDAGPTVFSPFKDDTGYFGNMDQQFMLNFRVADLDKLLAQLEAAGVKIAPERMNESYGRFAWVFDPEGRKIELWEPIEEHPK